MPPPHVMHVGSKSVALCGARLLWQRKEKNPSKMAVFHTLPSVHWRLSHRAHRLLTSGGVMGLQHRCVC